jgi:tetratricopeptide (TPR) repeat protein/predicted Ser/Thr protein kinase
LIGKTISHYRIIEKLGEGGMGIVYKAEDTTLKRAVALKFLPPEMTRNPEAKARLLHEAQAAAALDHPNICTIHEIGEADEQIFIAMAVIEGESLRDEIAGGPLRLDRAIDLSVQIAEGLAAAHKKGIVHRDMKPGNVMVTTERRAKIMDFGLAKSRGQERLTKTGTTTGTIAYMSPEQSRGKDVDHRTDIWSFGVMLYEMVTGQRPFRADYDQAVVYLIVNEDPEPMTALRTGVPLELERIAGKAMAKRPGERYQHVDDMMVDLRGLRKELEARTEIAPARPGTEESLWPAAREAATPAPEGPARPIIVIGFKNQTGDAAYDYLREAIPNLLITNLERSRYLQVTTWERMHDLLKQIGREDVEFIDRELGFELCRMEGVDSIVLGSFTKAGETFATDVKVLDVGTKRLLGSTSARGDGIASILKSQIDELSKDICEKVVIPERAVESSRLAVVDVTTSSMDAYNHFLRGQACWEKLYYADAVEAFERAVEIDPTFAAAHLYLGWSHLLSGNTSAGNGPIVSAMQLAEKATERVRLLTETAYAIYVERDYEKALHILHVMKDKFPREKLVHVWLGLVRYWAGGATEEVIAGLNRVLELAPNDGQALCFLAYIHSYLGDFERALEYAERYASVLPGDANPPDTMADVYFRMGRLDEAIAKYEEGRAIKPYFGTWKIAYVHALREDYSEAMRWADLLVTRTPAASPGGGRHVGKAFLHVWLGDSESALRELETAQAAARAAGSKFWEDEVDRTRAWMYYHLGEPERGRVFFENWVCAADEPSYPIATAPEWRSVAAYEIERSFYLGLADLREGRIASARSRLAEMESHASEERSRFRNWIPLLQDVLNAQVLLEEGSLDEAIKACKETPVPEAPEIGISTAQPYNVLFMRDALARAYVRSGELDKAIAEYERLLTFDPKSGDRRLIHPTYHYRLAKLYEEKGQTTKATSEYERFLEIWKDADEGRPEVMDARRRLAALSGT